VVQRTAKGYIAFRPIPGCRGTASCRPLRSWRLGRRSGRLPALPILRPSYSILAQTPAIRQFMVGSLPRLSLRGPASRFGQFPLPLGPDHLLTTGQHVRGCHATDRTKMVSVRKWCRFYLKKSLGRPNCHHLSCDRNILAATRAIRKPRSLGGSTGPEIRGFGSGLRCTTSTPAQAQQTCARASAKGRT
jgi:hypothetical protein